MATAATAVVPATSSTQLYQQAVTLLRQQKFDRALVAAKRALDGANAADSWSGASGATSNSVQQQLLLCAECWLAMAAAAAGLGDTEVAYCLYAKGYEHCQRNMPATAAATPVSASSSSNSSSTGSIADSSQCAADNVHRVVQQLSEGKLHMLAALCQTPAQQQQQQQDRHTLSGATSSNSSNSRSLVGKRWQRMEERFALHHSSSSSKSRVFCVSDLHVDKAAGANVSWVNSVSHTAFRNDVIIVAGDIADTAAAVAATFRALSARFLRVVWVPGNHELWLRPGSRDAAMYPDSFAKLFALRQIADECGVDVGPVDVPPGLIVLPLLSWYNRQYDTADPRPGKYLHDSFCRWPVFADDVWQVMMSLNSTSLELVKHRILELQRQRQQQQQQQQESLLGIRSKNSSSSSSRPVTWNTDGCLAVKSARRVPGLQVNLQPMTRRTLSSRALGHQQQQQQQQPSNHTAVPTRKEAAAAADSSVHGVQKESPSGLQTGDNLEGAALPALSAMPAAAAAAATMIPQHVTPTIITVSHFLPHPALPHSRFSELAKAMGCCELQLQLQQVCSQVHVYGHSHMNTDVVLPLPADLSAAAAAAGAELSHSRLLSSSSRRYVQYALDAVSAGSAGLYCLWDGEKLAQPGMIVPTA